MAAVTQKVLTRIIHIYGETNKLLNEDRIGIGEIKPRTYWTAAAQ